nr:MAG TPA: hypothetical protein [Caudoviricetes sp.]
MEYRHRWPTFAPDGIYCNSRKNGYSLIAVTVGLVASCRMAGYSHSLVA